MDPESGAEIVFAGRGRPRGSAVALGLGVGGVLLLFVFIPVCSDSLTLWTKMVWSVCERLLEAPNWRAAARMKGDRFLRSLKKPAAESRSGGRGGARVQEVQRTGPPPRTAMEGVVLDHARNQT